ncbi:ABC transporter ATP-binding protein [Pelagovum pacificum]|uniref:sn-glycerol-3-phosphate ABC transporter ATP-binding protein UgpC n=1 Tax=Pelagovum pacificum TaxID=2588711 RepID=A0A5C5GGD3_9RHOB|nr:sn-glycerol-3-phosphate ABC transporter ATP-binding protein UgpC [Pelagovum pacificum]QQA44282.1 sn-glycerol-3-phosphate ABC transporter ATP-binding protein UgpC [Pelagovum pacificum]TNY32596.1 sn-glycerol-3-phosphate ABC transporter ATP-binding protein UgpC [Pelagovum pacificum]
MGTLVLDNVQKRFGEIEVLHGVSLDVKDGEFIALVGPSGCGKSTLLRLIAGLDSVSGGRIEVDGKVMNEVAPKDRDVAMVFQSYALYPHMTVRDNMAFSLQMARAPKAEIEKSVRLAADILGLEPYLDRKPRELSGGQMQRVAMGRAIVRNPEIFLFDEPLSNLDAKLRGKVRKEIQALHRRLGTTTIYVTHDQVEAMTLANRLVVMNGGHVEQIGTPLELFDKPATEFVAGFIGAPPMNLIRGTGRGGRFVSEDGTDLAVEGPVPEGAITLGVRPGHLRRADDGWPATVEVCETMGHETHVSCDICGCNSIFLMEDRDFPRPGETVKVRPAASSLHWFRDGQRLEPVPA